jgi:hypothetical protein
VCVHLCPYDRIGRGVHARQIEFLKNTIWNNQEDGRKTCVGMITCRPFTSPRSGLPMQLLAIEGQPCSSRHKPRANHRLRSWPGGSDAAGWWRMLWLTEITNRVSGIPCKHDFSIMKMRDRGGTSSTLRLSWQDQGACLIPL